jgi:DNA-binding response OmpR family regulator
MAMSVSDEDDRLVHRQFRRRSQQAAVRPQPEGDPGANRVLLLEDNLAMSSLLVRFLEDEGYEVVEMSSKAPLIHRIVRGEMLERDPSFDLIISDVRMPVHTGVELLQGLRSFDFLQPVILITSFGDREIHAEAERLGATLLEKPFDLEELVRSIDELVHPNVDHFVSLAATGY